MEVKIQMEISSNKRRAWELSKISTNKSHNLVLKLNSLLGQ